MRFRAADGTPLNLHIDNPAVPTDLHQYADVNGFLPSEWKLIEPTPGDFQWVPYQ